MKWKVFFFFSVHHQSFRSFILFLNCRAKCKVSEKNWKRHPPHTETATQEEIERQRERELKPLHHFLWDSHGPPHPSLWLLCPKGEMQCDKNNLFLWITAKCTNLASTTGKQQWNLFAISLIRLFQSYALLIPSKAVHVSSSVNFLFILCLFFTVILMVFDFFKPQTPLNSYCLPDAALGFACSVLQGADAEKGEESRQFCGFAGDQGASLWEIQMGIGRSRQRSLQTVTLIWHPRKRKGRGRAGAGLGREGLGPRFQRWQSWLSQHGAPEHRLLVGGVTGWAEMARSWHHPHAVTG